MYFDFENVDFGKYGDGTMTYAKGEITNNSSKDYNTAVFRITLFDRNKLITWTGNFKIRSFRRGSTRDFELTMDGLDHTLVNAISKFDIFFEGGF